MQKKNKEAENMKNNILANKSDLIDMQQAKTNLFNVVYYSKNINKQQEGF